MFGIMSGSEGESARVGFYVCFMHMKANSEVAAGGQQTSPRWQLLGVSQ